MKVKDIIDENFQDYKKPSMLIATCQCDWKCCKEQGIPKTICQNSSIAQQKDLEVSADEMFRRYQSNPITKAIVFGGLEPMLQFNDVLDIIIHLRTHGCDDDVVIYTGYCPVEIADKLAILRGYKNIVFKFGRFKLNNVKKYDEVLGIYLSSGNQWGERIS